jgi:hypothetical protein
VQKKLLNRAFEVQADGVLDMLDVAPMSKCGGLVVLLTLCVADRRVQPITDGDQA